MAYLDVNEAYTMEVRVRALSGQSFQFHIDQFAIIGDVKQRLSNGLARKFHEMKLLYNSEEPGVFEKVGKFRNRSGIVELTLVINRTCRWCNLQINDNIVAPLLGTSTGDFCGTHCYYSMQRELQDPNNIFKVFGMSFEQPRHDLRPTGPSSLRPL
ncbi:unnamed protein product [Durusdinium trenchii]|uniref:Ubiquitin-like domain-containing protein n=2 Tax=Durusdinium trenchii TaxID=1381693 RepID=A0ABP0L946_9DINO